MNLKLVISLLLAVSVPTIFSACTKAESKSEEVVFDRRSGNSSDEVFITNSDVKGQTAPQQVPEMLKGTQLAKRILSDNSSVETVIDGFGNKTETRYFKEHSRLRMVILRTSVKGVLEVTVYGYGGTKTVAGLGDRAMTASADEIANSAQLTVTTRSRTADNFMKKSKNAAQTPLQPLPSSAFQQPATPVTPQVQSVQPQSSSSRETPATQPANPEED